MSLDMKRIDIFDARFVFNSEYYSEFEDVYEAYNTFFNGTPKEKDDTRRRELRQKKHQALRRKRAHIVSTLQSGSYSIKRGDKEVRVDYLIGEGLRLLRKLRSRK